MSERIDRHFVNPLQSLLERHRYVVLDGGLATELEKKGAVLKDPLWSAKLLIEQPELIQQVHEDYVRAGADIICSASYQASFPALANRNIVGNEAKEIFEKSVQLARTAIESAWSGSEEQIDERGEPYLPKINRCKPIVAASLGPYGSYEGSEFKGNYGKTVEELMEFHKPRISAVLGGQPDLLLLETVPCGKEEAEAIARLLEETVEFREVPTIVSFSCQNGELTNCGEPIEQAVKRMDKVGNIIGIGVNCTSPLYVSSLITHMKPHTSKLIVVYPNSGETWQHETYTWKENTHHNIYNFTAEWYNLGAQVFGGCCRTSPGDITNVRKVLDTLTRK